VIQDDAGNIQTDAPGRNEALIQVRVLHGPETPGHDAELFAIPACRAHIRRAETTRQQAYLFSRSTTKGSSPSETVLSPLYTQISTVTSTVWIGDAWFIPAW
jgi:hypothetical protein